MELNEDTQYLGGICRRGHNFNGTGKSLRKLSDRGCIQCCAENARKRYAANPAEARSKIKAREEKNKERNRMLNTERKKKSRLKNRDWHNEYAREYYRLNAVRKRIHSRLTFALRVQQKIVKDRTLKQYGIDVHAIIKHLGPCPGDIKDYHIDHIKPLSSFDFTDFNQIREAFSPENHQWLTKEQNMMKHNKLDWKPE